MLPSPDKGKLDGLHREGALEHAIEVMARSEAANVLVAHRHLLKGRMRRIFDLYHIKGLSQAVIANKLGLHRQTVATALRNARVLHGQLKKGMPLVEVVRRTLSLGVRHTEPEHDPEVLEWGDEKGDAVICTFLQGRLQSFELRLMEPTQASSPSDTAEPIPPGT